MARKVGLAQKELIVNVFNVKYPIGTLVRYWPGARDGDYLTGTLKHPAELLGGHTPVAWIEGARACVALTHVEVLMAAARASGKGSRHGRIS